MYNKDDIRSPSTCTCENGKYLENFIDNSVNICDEIIDAYGQSQQNIWQLQQERNPKMDNVYNLLYFCISIFYYVLLHF